MSDAAFRRLKHDGRKAACMLIEDEAYWERQAELEDERRNDA